MQQHLSTAVKGFFMGAANVIPGVSGGTIALLTGIFTPLVEALNALSEPSVWKKLFRGDLRGWWTDIRGTFLCWLFAGVLLSVLSLAKLMEYVLLHHPVQTWAFFFGLILASAAVMLCGVKGWTVRDMLWTAAGIALGVSVCTLTPSDTPDGLWFIFLCGAIAICTMILPGVSGSFILVILGKYDTVMHALGSLMTPGDGRMQALLLLAIFGLGCVIGLVAFSKFLHWLLRRHERATMLVLLGFVLGSLVKVWPWSNPDALLAGNLLCGCESSDLHIGGAVLWALLGIAAVAALEWAGHRKHAGGNLADS